jgi:hypothetical protein
VRHWPDLTIPANVAKRIPPYTGVEKDPAKLTAFVRFYNPASRDAWYVCEYDGADKCWGFTCIVNDVNQVRAFTLSNLSDFVNNTGEGARLDSDFRPMNLLAVLEAMEHGRL